MMELRKNISGFQLQKEMKTNHYEPKMKPRIHKELSLKTWQNAQIKLLYGIN